jgi:hypothetical protein
MLKQLLRTLLVLCAPLIGSAQQNVYVTSEWNFESCSGIPCLFTSELANVPPGKYVINAKLVLRNLDGDGQSGRCNLLAYLPSSATPHPPGFQFIAPGVLLIDRSDFRIPGGDNIQSVVALQAVYVAPPQDAAPYKINFSVQCSAFNTEGQELVFTAIQLPSVTNIIPGTSGYQGPPVN